MVDAESAFDSAEDIQRVFDDFMNTRMIAEKLYTQVILGIFALILNFCLGTWYTNELPCVGR